MNNDIKKEDMLELERRRLNEKVTEAVEKTLRKRYAWFGLIVAFLTGGGATLLVHSVLSEVKSELGVAKFIHSQSEEKLKEISRITKDIENTSERVKQLETDAESIRKRLEDGITAFSRTLVQLEERRAEASRTVESTQSERQKRVEQILNLVDRLNPAKAFELNERLPVTNKVIEQIVEARDPERRRLSTDKKGRKGNQEVAKEILKMRIVLGERSDADLDAWEAAIKAAE